MVWDITLYSVRMQRLFSLVLNALANIEQIPTYLRGNSTLWMFNSYKFMLNNQTKI